MTRSSAAPVCATALVGIFTACGPPTTALHTVAKPIASAAPLVAPPAEHPARWVLHPSWPSPMHVRIDLGAAGVLYAGDDGERWLDKNGQGIAATSLLPESIAAVGRTAESFLFISKSGNVHVVAASDPLGPSIATHAPPKPLRSAAAGKKSVFGIADGALFRSTDAGATWAQVTLPSTAGTLRQIAMLPNGDGLLLFAPQRAMATTDDGATWTAIATPGVGARRVVADANGDLMLEGLQASGILRMEPLRLEKIARAPAGDPDFPTQTDALPAGYATAIARGNAVLIGTSYAEVAPTPGQNDDATHWSFGAASLTESPKLKISALFDGCNNVLLAGAMPTPQSNPSPSGPGATILEAGCVREPRPSPTPSANGLPSKKIEDHWNVHLFRSDDLGKTWRPDGAAFSADTGARRLWVAGDGTTILDGACKYSHLDYSCDESPPLVRVAGSQSFAKVTGRPFTQFSDVVFADAPAATTASPGHRAYALGSVNRSGRIGLYVSTDGGKDFTRKPLPATSEKKGNSGEILVPEFSDDRPTSLTVDDAGVVIAAVGIGGRFVVYETRDDGATFDTRIVPFENIHHVELAGRHGFAWSSSGPSYETSDGGVSWAEAEAPRSSNEKTELACNAYACLLGDLATRIGWNDSAGQKSAPTSIAQKKVKPLSPIRCSPAGNWSSLGSFSNTQQQLPDYNHADLGGGTRFTLLRQDKDGSVVAIVGTRAKEKSPGDVVEVVHVPLFGPAPKDTALWSTMQLEGVAALRYQFKRDAPSSKKPGAAPWSWGPVKKDQLVDVEVAWYLAADGKVHRATIKGAGPLEPSALYDRRDQPSTALTGMLSIAMGGIHVRPFRPAGGAKQDAPLYFITDAGKIETLTWPELPKKDARGHNLDLTTTLDAARIGNRSLVFGYPAWRGPLPPEGLQLAMAWSSGGKASTWDERTWGLWPHDDVGAVRLRYVDSGTTPAFVVLFDGGTSDASASWMLPLKTPEADPSVVVALPTSASLPDAPRACGKAEWSSPRFTLPTSDAARHPITIDGDVDLTMATREVIVRVSPDGKNPCVSSWDAVVVGSKKTMESYSALLPFDDLGHAALFRSKNGEVSTRALRCELVVGAPLPKAFEGIDGFE